MDHSGRIAQVAALFDRVAPTYDTTGHPWFTPIAAALVAEVAPRPGERVLDIGTGRGAALWAAAEAVGPGGSAAGIDIAPGMVAAAREEAARRNVSVRIELGDATAPAAGLGPVDLIVSSLVLFFLPDPAAAVRSWVDLLAPAGRLGVATFGPRDPVWERLDAVFVPYLPPELLDARTSGSRGPFASDEGVAGLLAAAGLREVRTRHFKQHLHLRDVGDWRHWSGSHGQRGMWEAAGDAAPEVLALAAERLEAARDGDGYTLGQDVRLTVGHR
ncbi:MAG: methyltransferase domain-containing protein [Propionibacteriaceae bacterium]|nr:methyltransferase domain-containing protein [Propionibacteriaceae bacterium]